MSRARTLLTLVAVAGLAVGGCSSSSTSSASSSSASSSSDLCGSADALRSSIGDLKDVQVAQDGTEALRQAFSKVGDDVNRLADDARDQYSGQVADVESAVGDLRAAIDTLGSSPTAATVRAGGDAARTLVQNAGVLVDDASSSC
jgi:uncharacterized protein YoxC